MVNAEQIFLKKRLSKNFLVTSVYPQN